MSLETIDEEKQGTYCSSSSAESKFAYLPMDILSNIGELKFGKRVDRDSDYFFPVTYNGKTCHIETPKCLFMFGLEKYRNPGGKFDKYSINLSLREICREAENGHNVTNFRYLLENMDLFAQQEIYDDPKFVYFSSVRPNHKDAKKPPVLRIKVPSDSKRLKITIVREDGKEQYYPLVAEFDAMFKHRNEVKCIIEVNPIWYAGGKVDMDPSKLKPKKFGISYKLIKIQLADAGRRLVKFR